MKITKQQLKQIIREELQKEGFLDKFKGVFGGKTEEEKIADANAIKQIETIYNQNKNKQFDTPGNFMDKAGLIAFAQAFALRNMNKPAGPGDRPKPLIGDFNLVQKIGNFGEAYFGLDDNERLPRVGNVIDRIADYLQDKFSPEGDLRENPAENLKTLLSQIKQAAVLAKQAAKFDPTIMRTGKRSSGFEGSLSQADPVFQESLKKIIREEIIKFAEVK